MLRISNVSSSHGKISAVRDVSLEVGTSGIVALIGNGGVEAISRIMGFLLVCMGVQFVINGVLQPAYVAGMTLREMCGTAMRSPLKIIKLPPAVTH